MLKFIFNFFMVSFVCFFAAVKAYACASCGFNDDSSPYFLVLIVFMTSIPIICIGSVVYYLKKHSEKDNALKNTQNDGKNTWSP